MVGTHYGAVDSGVKLDQLRLQRRLQFVGEEGASGGAATFKEGDLSIGVCLGLLETLGCQSHGFQGVCESHLGASPHHFTLHLHQGPQPVQARPQVHQPLEAPPLIRYSQRPSHQALLAHF